VAFWLDWEGRLLALADIEAQTNGPKKIRIDLDPLEWLIIAIMVITCTYLVY